MSERLTPEDRYNSDPQFRVLVDMLHNAIRNAQYTPTEIREDAMLAAIHHDMTTVRSPFIVRKPAD